MPKQDEVGYGEFTPLKIEHLEKIFGMHLAITQAVLKRSPYYKQSYRYLDLTAGKGYTPETNALGSPLVFIKSSSSSKIQIPCKVDLCEKENINHDELVKHFQSYSKEYGWGVSNEVSFHHDAYENIIPSLIPIVDAKEFGMAFVDHTGNLPDFEVLKHISAVRPKMEILLYISARIIKRLHHITGKSLSDYMKEIDKKHWLIRKPVKWDNMEWTFLLGSNTDIFKNYKKIDFYRYDSKEAQRFFPKLNLTVKQRMEKAQPKLPGI